MSHEHSRRSSMVPFSNTNHIPTAPPLPAPKPLQRAREAATRLFGYSSRPPSPQEQDRLRRVSQARFPSLGATQNATASHKTGLEINTISINEEGTHAVLGGKEIFKTVKIENGICAEELNLRSAIRSNPRQASGSARQIYSIDIADVAWAKGDCGNYVAAATSSGKIILYDLGHAGVPAAQLHEHFRQVHNVTFNPHRGSLLLSGSQDGTVRLWDVRDVRQASTLKSKQKYSGQADGVRDVKWSPTEGVDFAFGTDSGWVQRWDMRNLKTAKVKIPAHSTTCNTIDWHPDGKHIVSASSDKTVRVWDFSANRKQKASWEIKTPYPVLNARWRPSCESWVPQDQGARQCTQIVTSYDQTHPLLHIWDFRRPALPFREMCPYPTSATDLLWHSQDLLWTVGREGVFLQSDIAHAPKVIDKRNLQALAVSPLGDVNLVTQQRRQHQHRVPNQSGVHSIASGYSRNTEHSALSRSWTDDGLDHSFLSALPVKRIQKPSNKSRTQSLSMAPSNEALHVPAAAINLDEILLHSKSFRPLQIACRGIIPGWIDVKTIAFLARESKMSLETVYAAEDFVKALKELLDHNAHCADVAGLYRLAQTWRIISFATINHLKERAEVKKKQVTVGRPYIQLPPGKGSLSQLVKKLMGESKSPVPSPVSLKPVSSIARQLALSDSASSQRTPVAKAKSVDRDGLPDPERDDQLSLPPRLSYQPSHDRRLTISNLDGLQKLHHNTNEGDRADMVRRWNVQPKAPLSLDPVGTNGIKIPPRLEKHDSDESFAFLAASTDSRGPSFPSSYESSKSDRPLQMVAERPSKNVGGGGITLDAMEKRHSSPGPSFKASEFKIAPVVKSIFPEKESGDAPRLPLNDHQSSTAPKEKSLYLPEDDDADLEENKPFTLIEMLRELVGHYASKGDAQTAAHLLLVFGPLLPRTHALSPSEITTVVSTYIECFTFAGYAQDEVEALLDNHFESVMMSGLNPLQVEAILSTYHEQLLRYRLFNEAAMLRKLSFPMYPSVYDQTLKDNSIHLKCGDCGKPIAAGMKTLQCESCGTKQATCPICWCNESPFDEKRSAILSTCLLCNHSGHAACLHEWFGDLEGDGACPTEGCLCDCIAGTWRTEKAKLAEKKRRYKSHVRVKSDDWAASESKAVERTREVLGIGPGGLL